MSTRNWKFSLFIAGLCFLSAAVYAWLKDWALATMSASACMGWAYAAAAERELSKIVLHESAQPCPFCGAEIDIHDLDTLYLAGIFWRDLESGVKSYHRAGERQEGDNPCYLIRCSKGCGAEIVGDSREDALAAWNRRPT